MSNMASVGGNLEIFSNDSLNSFCGLYLLLNSCGLTGSYTVSDNLFNPTQQEIITDGPCTTTEVAENDFTPVQYQLHQNYPNPFNPTSVIGYSVKDAGLVTLKVFNILGQEVAVLVNEIKAPGNYDVSFDGSNLAGGVYIYRMQVAQFTDAKKMLLVK